MLNKKFSEFIKTTSISNLILVGLQAGKNVQIAISDIIKVITAQTQSAISSKADRTAIEISSVDELYDSCLKPGLYGISLYSPVEGFVELFGSSNISLLVSYADGDGSAGTPITQTAITPDGRMFSRTVLSDDTGDNFPLSLFAEIGQKMINIPAPIISVRNVEKGEILKQDVIHALVPELPAWMMALSPEITIMRRAHKSKRKPKGWKGEIPASIRRIDLTKWNDFLLSRFLSPSVDGTPLKAGGNAFPIGTYGRPVYLTHKDKPLTSEMIVKELATIDPNSISGSNNDTHCVRVHLSSCHSGYKSVHRDYYKSVPIGAAEPNLFCKDWGFSLRIRNPLYIASAGAHSIFKSFNGGWPTVEGIPPYLYSPIHRVRMGVLFYIKTDINFYPIDAEIKGVSITPL